ncbi:methyl-CpG-binding domain protein 4-like protein isoform X2 [Malania oleifera]|uniref:methyl-CpG-binding domain protein 4-like protein isoform X2 n=1 Tax=Malania oleifera TaxID=397392 RepID=UPI0025AE9877|nr:methyl-CpG-binding domain protein 4-like protein isoform X2 [Malania oleifera]XP_057948135.1 methyl-CpG-binding domain protein 4-like protein isoform X2 [Malania oleifera]
MISPYFHKVKDEEKWDENDNIKKMESESSVKRKINLFKYGVQNEADGDVLSAEICECDCMKKDRKDDKCCTEPLSFNAVNVERDMEEQKKMKKKEKKKSQRNFKAKMDVNQNARSSEFAGFVADKINIVDAFSKFTYKGDSKKMKGTGGRKELHVFSSSSRKVIKVEERDRDGEKLSMVPNCQTRVAIEGNGKAANNGKDDAVFAQGINDRFYRNDTGEENHDQKTLLVLSSYFQKVAIEDDGNVKEKRGKKEPYFSSENKIKQVFLLNNSARNSANETENGNTCLPKIIKSSRKGKNHQIDTTIENVSSKRRRRDEELKEKLHPPVRVVSRYFQIAKGQQVVTDERKEPNICPKQCKKSRQKVVVVSPYFYNVPKEGENADGNSIEGKDKGVKLVKEVRGPVLVKSTLSASQKQDEAYQRKSSDNTWTPPRSPFDLLQEDHAHDPWRVLVICMLLNCTTGLQICGVGTSLLSGC